MNVIPLPRSTYHKSNLDTNFLKHIVQLGIAFINNKFFSFLYVLNQFELNRKNKIDRGLPISQSSTIFGYIYIYIYT